MVRPRAVAIAVGTVVGAGLSAAIVAARDDGPTVARLDPSVTVTFAEPGLGGAPKIDGKPLPEGTFTRLDGNGTATFASLRGKPAVINLWSQTCAPCVKEMPLFDALAARLGDQVRVVGLNSGDTLSQARKFADKVGVSYELWLDDDRRGSTALEVTALPVTVFVAADGTIVRTKLGAFDQAGLDAAVQELLGR